LGLLLFVLVVQEREGAIGILFEGVMMGWLVEGIRWVIEI
jgi:hypothetical protein